MRRAGLPGVRAAPNPGGYTPIWPPTRIPGCVAWLDCQETLTQAGTVTSIRNMASGVDWTEASNPPTYDAAGINGKPCMIGNATNMLIMSTETAVVNAFVGVNREFTILAVIQPTAVTVAQPYSIFGAGKTVAETAGSLFFTRSAPNGRLRAVANDDANLALSWPAAGEVSTVLQLPQIAVMRTVAGRVNVFNSHAGVSPVGSIADGPFSAGQFTPDRVGLLCHPDATPDSLSGDKLGCLICYSRAITIQQTLGVMAALRGRWGLP